MEAWFEKYDCKLVMTSGNDWDTGWSCRVRHSSDSYGFIFGFVSPTESLEKMIYIDQTSWSYVSIACFIFREFNHFDPARPIVTDHPDFSYWSYGEN